MLTFVVDCCVYVWRNAHGMFVDTCVVVIVAVVAMVARLRSHATRHEVRLCMMAESHVRLRTMAYDKQKLCALLSMFDDLAGASMFDA